MRRSAAACALAAAAALAACSRAPEADVTPQATSRDTVRDSAKEPPVTTNAQAAVRSVTLTQAWAIGNRELAPALAVAPDGTRWAAAWPFGVRVYADDQEVATYATTHNAGGAIAFSPDGGALHLGLVELAVADGAERKQAVPDLAAWVAASGRSAPPSLTMPAAQTSADGALTVVAATAVTRDRTAGLRRPPTGDSEWLIALDGRTRAPTAVMWSGAQPHTRIAIAPAHVAAGGVAGLHVFARSALTAPIDLGLRSIIDVAWSADGALLAAAGDTRVVALWRAGSWSAPAARWEVGTAYASALAFHPGRPLLAIGSRDHHLRIVSVADPGKPAPVADLDVGGEIHAIAFTPDGRSALVSVGNPLVKLVRYDVAIAP
jgi:WD40 repeat protein